MILSFEEADSLSNAIFFAILYLEILYLSKYSKNVSQSCFFFKVHLVYGSLQKEEEIISTLQFEIIESIISFFVISLYPFKKISIVNCVTKSNFSILNICKHLLSC